jgi:hypothetical protein
VSVNLPSYLRYIETDHFVGQLSPQVFHLPNNLSDYRLKYAFFAFTNQLDLLKTALAKDCKTFTLDDFIYASKLSDELLQTNASLKDVNQRSNVTFDYYLPLLRMFTASQSMEKDSALGTREALSGVRLLI